MRRPFHWHATGAGIHAGRGLLHVAVGVVDLLRHPVVANVEVFEAALRLRTPIAIRGDFDGAEAVELLPHPHCVETDRQVEDLRLPSVVGRGRRC
jgi:hypothetical protein